MTTDNLGSETLSASGSTDAVTCVHKKNLLVQYKVTGVSGTLVVSVEGSNDSSNWFNLDENGSTSITSDGTYAFQISNTALEQVRFTWESGTTTSIEINFNGN